MPRSHRRLTTRTTVAILAAALLATSCAQSDSALESIASLDEVATAKWEVDEDGHHIRVYLADDKTDPDRVAYLVAEQALLHKSELADLEALTVAVGSGPGLGIFHYWQGNTYTKEPVE
jgi:hypothetical protein